MIELDVTTDNLRVKTSGGVDRDIRWAAVTDTGRKREINQDAYIARFPVFAVADGMGGHEAGEVASAAVVTRLTEVLDAETEIARSTLEDTLRSAIGDMFEAVGESDLGTGTTVTGLFSRDSGDDGWTVFNIGDSRVYRLLGDELVQVTIDHSVVQELMSIGAITPAEAETHPHANVITRAVGFTDDPTPDYVDVPFADGARWLVCSDGLTKELTDYGLQHFLLTSATPEDAVRALVGAALENGGRDNVTAIVLDEGPTPSAAPALDDSGTEVTE